ncbi:hypothetical protein PRIPAC_94295, partial [Pristionchus pacificus]
GDSSRLELSMWHKSSAVTVPLHSFIPFFHIWRSILRIDSSRIKFFVSSSLGVGLVSTFPHSLFSHPSLLYVRSLDNHAFILGCEFIFRLHSQIISRESPAGRHLRRSGCRRTRSMLNYAMPSRLSMPPSSELLESLLRWPSLLPDRHTEPPNQEQESHRWLSLALISS